MLETSRKLRGVQSSDTHVVMHVWELRGEALPGCPRPIRAGNSREPHGLAHQEPQKKEGERRGEKEEGENAKKKESVMKTKRNKTEEPERCSFINCSFLCCR